ncbi:hypothetical protein RND81_07G030800 [Saponaria officinalis]|uniref:Uncharacterized protein n=1 Tax=Saponaria officinalis TaxID=3572 RepID=A0AAW1JLK6_SAPOF
MEKAQRKFKAECDGFSTWSRTGAFNNHVGNHKSAHNNAMRDLDNFKKQKYSIVSRFENHSAATKSAYLTRLEASIKTARFLLLQGLSFRSHNEKETSLNRGNFIELLKFLAQHDQNIAKVVLENAPKNCILASSKIQKQIVNACAMDTTMKIVKELDGNFFGILADESADIADKEQMALCLRFVDKKEQVQERFFGIVHVEQDIVNAVKLVDVTKGSLQRIRDNGWDAHMEKVSIFCFKHDIDIPDMDDLYVIPGRHRRGRREVNNLQHFRAEVFLSVIDQIWTEFNDRFNEKGKELLVCMSCFNPQNRFASFDTKKLLQLAEFYPYEFSRKDLLYFEYQLDTFKYDVQNDNRFWNLKTLNELSMKLVKTMKHLTHSKVYMLLKIVLVLPVATTTVERAFSAMFFIKYRLRNSMGDEYLNDCLVTFLERDVFMNVTNDEIVKQFLDMRTRRIM